MSENPYSFIEETRPLIEEVTSLSKLKSRWITIVVIITQIFTIVWNSVKPPKELFPTVAILIIIFSSITLLAIQEYRYSRKTRYAEALVFIHSIVHRLRDTFNILNKFDSSNPEIRKQSNNIIFKEAEKIVTSFATAFSLITSVRCRACIKLIRLDETQKDYASLSKDEKERILYVETWTRDVDSNLFSPAGEEPKHWIYSNTDFKQLFDAQNPATNKYFLENNLPKKHNYQNTSFKLYGEPNEKWTLPYKSTIVWPIRRITSKYERDEEQFTDKQDVLGYLCIDSDARNVFNDRYDIHVGAIVADSLFVFLRRYFLWLQIKKGEGIK